MLIRESVNYAFSLSSSLYEFCRTKNFQLMRYCGLVHFQIPTNFRNIFLPGKKVIQNLNPGRVSKDFEELRKVTEDSLFNVTLTDEYIITYSLLVNLFSSLLTQRHIPLIFEMLPPLCSSEGPDSYEYGSARGTFFHPVRQHHSPTFFFPSLLRKYSSFPDIFHSQ